MYIEGLRSPFSIKKEEEADGMVSMVWPTFVFPPPSSVFVTAMSVISFTGLAYTGISEARGKHLQYSKFWQYNSGESRSQIHVSGRRGMQIIYTPAFLAGLTSLVFFPQYHDIRYLLVSSALTIHFLKRLLEVRLRTSHYFFLPIHRI